MLPTLLVALLQGFDHHVRFEHNMWSYIFFFIHLNGTKVNDYTALEMYVFKLVSGSAAPWPYTSSFCQARRSTFRGGEGVRDWAEHVRAVWSRRRSGREG